MRFRFCALPLLAALLGMLAGTLAGCSVAPVGASSPSQPRPTDNRLRIAAASDLRYALDELVAAWTRTVPGVPVDVTYGSSGSFFAQISQAAPFDLFFSADASYPRALETAGRAPAGATRIYAIGRLALWVRSSSTLDVAGRGLSALTDDAVRRVAIANPQHAPYGRAAAAALAAAGVEAAVTPKLVLGDNVAQAAQFVESGNADAGIIALSLALAPALAARGRHVIVPDDLYSRLEQGALVLQTAADPATASAFLDFVLGGDGRAVLERYGFGLPPP